jgi:phage-related tail fiber protein
VIGDASGIPYDPLTAINRTQLVNQKARIPIQHLEVINDVVRIQATIGADIGGFNIHEIGLTDESDQLVYIGNYHGV